MKRRSERGFTMAELLITVAIIAVLTAVAIPVFANQLEKSRESTDFANVRSAYAEVMVAANSGDTNLQVGDGAYEATVSLKQKQDGWTTDVSNMSIGGVPSGEWQGQPSANGDCTVVFDPLEAKAKIIWGTGYAHMSLSQLHSIDNGKRIEADQKTLANLGNKLLQKIQEEGWTDEQLNNNLGIKADRKNGKLSVIRIADYYQQKTEAYESDGFKITSNASGQLENLLQSIGFNTQGTVQDTKNKVYDNSLFYSDQLAANHMKDQNGNEYASNQTKRSILIDNITTDEDGKIQSMTLYTKAMDNQANLSAEEKKLFRVDLK